MYGHSTDVDVDAVEENKRISMRWPAYEGDTQTTVEWTFAARPDNTTFVAVTNTGFTGDQDAIAKQAIGATGGFTLVLAGRKEQCNACLSGRSDWSGRQAARAAADRARSPGDSDDQERRQSRGSAGPRRRGGCRRW